MTCIVRSGTVGELGGKAHALSQLGRAGLPIPEWFAVSPAAFERSLTCGQRAALTSLDPQLAGAAIADLQPSPDVVQEIRIALSSLPGAQFAVRSSAVDEDGSRDSFAGQLASYLFVPRERVSARVADVWRSGFAPRLLEYRRQRGLQHPANAPAVLVQCMIDAEASGVAFSADPVSGRRGLAVVSAVFGIGTALVGGEAGADVYEVNREGTVVRETIARKKLRHSFSDLAEEGAAAEMLPEELREKPVLPPRQVAEIAALVRRAAAAFGEPQDVEWAIGGGKLYLLQSRPVTTLRNLPDPDGVLNIWDNSNIIESYSGITTPLTFSFARLVYEGVYRRFCRILLVPGKKILANEGTYRQMLGLIRGRIYYNLLNWYRVLALLPGFTYNRRFMEQMMGVRESLPEEIASGLSSASRKERIADFFSLMHMVAALAWNLLALERQITRFRLRLNEALREPAPALSALRLDELVAYYEQLKEKLLEHWDAPLVNDFFAMIFHGALRKITLKWAGDETGLLANDLIRGQGGMISAEPAARVRELARMAAGDAGFVRCLCEGSNDDALQAMRDHPEFQAGYENYLARFGDRCLEELKLESETLHENPQILLRSIGELARAPQSGRAPSGADSGASASRAEQELRRALIRSPLKRAMATRVLRQARARVRQRENLRFERTRLFGRVRNVFRECGKRLHAEGTLDSPDDVFYLQVEEILGYVNGTGVSSGLRGLIDLRRSEFEDYRNTPAPPDRLETRGPVNQVQCFSTGARQCAEETSDEVRRGIGCCQGVVSGAVRVILDPRGASLPNGSILVAEHTDPGWIMLFPAALGLLVERGSLLSHSAIVARELGIPAVVSIPGLTHWLRDGDVVELDGARGVVRRIEARGGHGE